ncbi:MAG: DUF87 domain-containing protein [Nanoarchaeota archaeon]|nr:DUF87 domain-containing protein [Nanoarchaeota archaeon]
MKLNISEDVAIEAEDLVTGRTCVIGQSGSGKSYTIAVICEELAKNNLGFCIVDTEGEYFSLKEKYQILWIGSDERCDIDISKVDFKKLAEKALKKNFPIIFDVSEAEKPKEKVNQLLNAFYKASSKLKQPYLIIIEEVDKFAPQKGEVLPSIEEISRRGRKRGLGLLIATQRPAFVNKDILSQCGNQIIGKLTIKNDIDAVRLFFQDKKNLEKLPQLKAGQFFIQGEITNVPTLAKIRKRETKHKAVTPKISQKRITKNIKEFQQELTKESPPQTEEVTIIGIKPQITEKDAFERIKNSTKRFKLFGRTAHVIGLHLILLPIYSCDIKYLKKKIIGHEFITIHSYFNSINGDIVSLDKGYRPIFKTKTFLEFDTNDLEVFKVISSNKKITTTEIAYKLKRSPEAVRLSLKKLIENGLINYKKVGRNRIYFPFTKERIPSVKKIATKKVDTNRLKLNARKLEPKIDTKQLSSFVRSLGEKIDIVDEKRIYYPIYKASIVRANSEKEAYVDAVTGRIVKCPL